MDNEQADVVDSGHIDSRACFASMLTCMRSCVRDQSMLCNQNMELFEQGVLERYYCWSSANRVGRAPFYFLQAEMI